MIKIENEQLSNYLMFKLDKQSNEFTEDELKQIDTILLNSIDLDGNQFEIDFDVIKLFKNIKNLTLQNLYISENDIFALNTLNHLANLYIEKCEFENADILSNLNVKEIELINCNIIDYTFLYKMTNLKSLSVVNGNISLKEINNLKNLTYLQLSYSNIANILKLDLPSLTELHIDNTKIEDFAILKNLHNLKRLGISEKQFIENKQFVEDLIKNNVIVMNENIVEFNQGDNKND